MRFTPAVIGIFASVALAAPIPQFQISGPLGSVSLPGFLSGESAVFEGPLGTATLGGIGNFGASFEGRRTGLGLSFGQNGGKDDDDRRDGRPTVVYTNGPPPPNYYNGPGPNYYNGPPPSNYNNGPGPNRNNGPRNDGRW